MAVLSQEGLVRKIEEATRVWEGRKNERDQVQERSPDAGSLEMLDKEVAMAQKKLEGLLSQLATWRSGGTP